MSGQCTENIPFSSQCKYHNQSQFQRILGCMTIPLWLSDLSLVLAIVSEFLTIRSISHRDLPTLFPIEFLTLYFVTCWAGGPSASTLTSGLCVPGTRNNFQLRWIKMTPDMAIYHMEILKKYASWLWTSDGVLKYSVPFYWKKFFICLLLSRDPFFMQLCLEKIISIS